MQDRAIVCVRESANASETELDHRSTMRGELWVSFDGLRPSARRQLYLRSLPAYRMATNGALGCVEKGEVSIAPDRHAAIDHDFGPGDEARFVGGKKQRRVCGI